MIKFFKLIVELIGAIQITLFPLLISAFVGAILYSYNKNNIGIILCSICILSGLFLGIALAFRIKKKRGILFLLSRIRATPELDEKKADEKKSHEDVISK